MQGFSTKSRRDHDHKRQKSGKGPAEDCILLQPLPESRPGQQKFLTQLLDKSVKELGIGLQSVTKPKMLQAFRQLLWEIESPEHDGNDVLLLRQRALHLQADPVIGIGTPVQRAGRQDQEKIPALVDHRIELCIEISGP